MRFVLTVLLLVVETVGGAPTFAGYSFEANGFKKLFTQSIFNGEEPPREIIPGYQIPYDPMLVSVLASVKSREPERDKTLWEEIELPAHDQSLCRGPMRAYLKKSHSHSQYTFVVLPGSYATWGRGSFSNQTSDVLNREFGDPNIISFAGYLSPDFLKGTCSKIPWDGNAMARDFYFRLKEKLARLGAKPDLTGAIGFSGGGFLSLAMLSIDTDEVQHGGRRVFGLGAMAFSPILHARTAFENLDRRFKASRIDKSLGLTTGLMELDFKNVAFLVKSLIKNSFRPPNWEQLLSVYAANPVEFVDRAYNEFTIMDLKDTLTAVGVKSNRLTYHDVYVREGFQRDTGTSDQELLDKYDEATDVGAIVSRIDRPFFIYFSKDDPVLSNSEGSGQPMAVKKVLMRAKQNPHGIVFNPPYGAHTGALLDPIFEFAVTRFFAADPNPGLPWAWP